MTIYVSGPITGIEGGNRKAFDEMALKLRDMGHMTINPHEIGDGLPRDSSWETYMRADVRRMMDADAVFTLPNWFTSRGAVIEVELADDLGMEIYHDLREVPVAN